jgi:hypothetical protein
MGDFDLVSAADVRLMQGLAQRVTVVRPDLVNSDASFGELAWIWGKGHASDGGTWPRRLWFSSDLLVAWGWAFLPHQVRRSDGSVTDVTSAYLDYQVHPGHAALVDEVIDWYDAAAAALDRTVAPSAADEFALSRWAAHGYQTDPASLGDTGSWTQLNQRSLTDVEQPVLPDGFRFRTAEGARALLRSRVPEVHAGCAAHQACALEPTCSTASRTMSTAFQIGCLVEAEEPLVGLGYSVAIAGGQQVQEQAADHGHAEPGIHAGRCLAGPGLDHRRGDGSDPAFDSAVQEPLVAQAAEQGLDV